MKQQSYHLISHTLCPYVQRSVITLEEKSIDYTRSDIDLQNKPAWFKQASPMGKVPLLLVNNSHSIFESAVICEYLDEVTPNSLHPKDYLEKAHHRSWIAFGSEILNNIARLYNADDIEHFQKIHIQIQKSFQHIEKVIYGTPFFSGEKFHIIDATYAPIFRYFDVFDSFSDLKTFTNLPRCQLWRNALRQRKSIQNAVAKDYSSLLIQFLIDRESYISKLIPNVEQVTI
jgi:glutathione S-transferase